MEKELSILKELNRRCLEKYHESKDEEERAEINNIRASIMHAIHEIEEEPAEDTPEFVIGVIRDQTSRVDAICISEEACADTERSPTIFNPLCSNSFKPIKND